MTAPKHQASFKNVLLCGTMLALAMTSLASCSMNRRSNDVTGSIPATSRPIDEMNQSELAAVEKQIGAAYARNPNDRNAGINYANLLRMTGKNNQALAVMQQVAIKNPADREVLAGYGKAQAAAGQLEQALTTIARAQTPDRPDWKLKSAEGAILDQLGRPAEARAAYRSALDIMPNEPTVLSNLGMSYLLAKDPRTAETYLRNAAAQPGADSRVRQNLALVIGLQGRFAEAEQMARQELSPQQAEANVAYLRGMLAQENSWKKLAANDADNTN